MKKLIRLAAASAIAGAVMFGSFALLTPAEAGGSSCAPGQCKKNYRECLIICSKNPCIISCETQLEICLSSCD